MILKVGFYFLCCFCSFTISPIFHSVLHTPMMLTQARNNLITCIIATHVQACTYPYTLISTLWSTHTPPSHTQALTLKHTYTPINKHTWHTHIPTHTHREKHTHIHTHTGTFWSTHTHRHTFMLTYTVEGHTHAHRQRDILSYWEGSCERMRRGKKCRGGRERERWKGKIKDR